MDEELAKIRTTLECSQVLSREDLAHRLATWQSMGLPDAATDGITFELSSVDWNRPVFGEITRLEPAESKVAHIHNRELDQNVVFDPEFLIFGPKGDNQTFALAGLPPWINSVDRYGKHNILPFTKTDLLGKLFQGMARLRQADFLAIPRSCIPDRINLSDDACWLLFCTHPLREAENTLSPKPRPFLTYYAFPQMIDGDTTHPLSDEGADPKEVHEFLVGVEEYARGGALSGMSDQTQLQEARNAGTMVQKWVESVTRFGATAFLEKEKWFVPIPVALVAIAD
jgi:hypothetical protein